jgi:hypothetical protein
MIPFVNRLPWPKTKAYARGVFGMVGPTDPTETEHLNLIRCPDCGHYSPMDYTYCPKCGHLLPLLISPDPGPQKPDEVPVPPEQERPEHFAPHAHLILQVVAFRQRVSLPLDSTVILGRFSSTSVNREGRFDLSRFDGCEQGVSRRHCQLQRRGEQLLVTDLASRNGTCLNGKPLAPHQNYVVAHGDRLTLGKLHVILGFSTMESDE